MPKYTREEFIDLCGGSISRSDLRVYIKRKKVIENNGFIDTSDPVNQLFVEKRTLINQIKEESAPSRKDKKNDSTPPEERETEFRESKRDHIDFANRSGLLFTEEELNKMELVDLERAKKYVDILRTQENIRLIRIQKERLEAKLIPTDLVKDIFRQHFKNMGDEFYQAADNLILIINQRYGGTREDMIKLRSELKGLINDSIKRGKTQSHKDITMLAQDFSESFKKSV